MLLTLESRQSIDPDEDENDAPDIWIPSPKQLEAINCPADILLYGGEAGGGKSDLLLGLAITRQVNSIIYRREYEQTLKMRQRLVEIMGGIQTISVRSKTHKLPDDRMLEFGGCKDAGSEMKYQGWPHDAKLFDEVTHFLESQFRFLIGWLRSVIPGQRTRVVATSNPPISEEQKWVTEFWAPWLKPDYPNPAKPGELRHFIVVEGKDIEVKDNKSVEMENPRTGKIEIFEPLSRSFIPASLDDNPYLDTHGYRRVLHSLPEPLRSQLLHGDYQAGIDDDPFQVFPTEWILKAQERWKHRPKPDIQMSSLGTDCARGGNNNMILSPRYGNYFDKQIVIEGYKVPDGSTAAGYILIYIGPLATANIDVIGIGSSVYDHAKELYRGENETNQIRCLPLNGAAASTATDRTGKLHFRNKRAEWYWQFREALDPELGEDIAIPPTSELRADMVAIHWKITPSGIQIESKEDIIARIGRSPDYSDSMIYAKAESADWKIRQHTEINTMISADGSDFSADDQDGDDFYYDGD